MDTHRIRIKVGEHEFEAVGDQETVQRELDRFYQAIKDFGNQPVPVPVPVPVPAAAPTPTRVEKEVTISWESTAAVSSEAKIPWESLAPQIPESLSTIFSYEDGILRLIARLPSHKLARDAALLLIYGHKVIMNRTTVTASDLIQSMRATGYNVHRVDRLVSLFILAKMVHASGIKRGRAYQLKEPGFQAAESLIEELRSLVP